jgi:NAD(P)-dependent dehydrogenase (short-subunit alcohol dehydrogenase family)
MNIRGKVALVTGANRGLGQAFVQALLAAGAAKVYAAARHPGSIAIPGAEAIALDITDAQSVAAAARYCQDVDLLINNAGIFQPGSLLAAEATRALRAQLDTNLFGTLAVTQAFVPVLRKRGGGAVVNILSVLSWIAIEGSGAYSASKAAEWAVTNSLRNELRGDNIQVIGVHPAYIDTDMTAGVTAAKTRPEDVVSEVLNAVEQGLNEVLVDDTGRAVKQSLSSATAAAYLNTAR